MTRLSRISAPRATMVAFALLAVAFFGFRMLAEAGHGDVLATQEASSEHSLRDLPQICRDEAWRRTLAVRVAAARPAGGAHEQA